MLFFERKNNNTRRARRRLSGGESLEDRRLLAFDPSPFEQEQLEHINRMRLDPAAELGIFFDTLSPLTTSETGSFTPIQDALDHFGVSGTTLQVQWGQLQAVPPLAWNESLYDAAELHSELSIQENLQAHRIWDDANENGLKDNNEDFIEPELLTRIQDSGYSSGTLFLENVYTFAESMIHGHAGFVIDWGDTATGIQEPPGHRNNIMSDEISEVGISVIDNGPIPTTDLTTVGPFVITQEFAQRSNYTQQILGVVWEDGFANGYYEAGEGYGGVSIEVIGDNGFRETLETMSAGGYQVEVPAGTYEVIASDPNLDTYSVGNIVVDDQNVKVDFNIANGFANLSPVASGDSFDIDGSRVINVLSNDSDSDGTIDATSVEIITQPTAGTVSVDPTSGEITYTADGTATTDSFEYLLRDDDGASATATVTLNIEEIVAANVPPVASDGAFTVSEDSAQSRSLASLVTDSDGTVDWSTFEIVDTPSRGTLTFESSSQSFTYEGQSNFNGTDSFEFRVADDDGDFSNTATVDLTIENVNDAPVANDDIVATAAGETRTFELFANDTDADNNNLANGSIEVINAPENGSVGISGTTVTYVADATFTGSETFTYRIRDEFNAPSNTATVTVYVADPDFRWHNPVTPADVDGDGAIGPLDAIRVINVIPISNISFPSTIPGLENAPLPFLDVFKDGHISPLDALMVINALPSNTATAAAAALSGSAVVPAAVDVVTHDTAVREFAIAGLESAAVTSNAENDRLPRRTRSHSLARRGGVVGRVFVQSANEEFLIDGLLANDDLL